MHLPAGLPPNISTSDNIMRLDILEFVNFVFHEEVLKEVTDETNSDAHINDTESFMFTDSIY